MCEKKKFCVCKQIMTYTEAKNIGAYCLPKMAEGDTISAKEFVKTLTPCNECPQHGKHSHATILAHESGLYAPGLSVLMCSHKPGEKSAVMPTITIGDSVPTPSGVANSFQNMY